MLNNPKLRKLIKSSYEEKVEFVKSRAELLNDITEREEKAKNDFMKKQFESMLLDEVNLTEERMLYIGLLNTIYEIYGFNYNNVKRLNYSPLKL